MTKITSIEDWTLRGRSSERELLFNSLLALSRAILGEELVIS